MYRYRLNDTKLGSNTYGPCEVCQNHASEIWIQTETKSFIDEDGQTAWTHHECTPTLFGHRECLIERQKI